MTEQTEQTERPRPVHRSPHGTYIVIEPTPVSKDRARGGKKYPHCHTGR